jgi:hypothetical protein
MKKVFNNSQLCHIWANESQSEGSNPGNSLYFEATEIYSYGSHYLAGKIFTVKGEKFAIVNNHNYSNATAKHLACIRSALHGKMPYFCLPNVSDSKDRENIDYLNQTVFNCLDSILSSRKQSGKYDIDRLESTIKNANEFFTLVNEKLIVITSDFLELLKEVNSDKLALRKERDALNNSPEMIAKKEASIKAKNALLQAEKALLQAEKINKFRSFEARSVNIRPHLLRIKDDTVQTSSGADVPLNDAIKLLELVLSDQCKRGDKIGHFSLDGVLYDQENRERVIKIGCHDILVSEAVAVLGHLIKKEI